MEHLTLHPLDLSQCGVLICANHYTCGNKPTTTTQRELFIVHIKIVRQ